MNYHDRTTLREVPPEEAPDYFEKEGLAPKEVLRAIQADFADAEEHTPGAYLSPTLSCPEVTCRREVALRRVMERASVDPLAEWRKLEGKWMHLALARFSAPGDLSEVMLPADPEWSEWQEAHGDDRKHPKVKRCEDGALRVEVLDGIWMRGILDRVSPTPSGVEIVDFKTKAYPWHPWGKEPNEKYLPAQMDEWTPQLNLYKRMWEILRPTKVTDLKVWRVYSGARDVNFAFRCLPVPLWPRDKLVERSGKFMLSLIAHIESALDAKQVSDAALGDVIRAIPMDGAIKKMFNDKKCEKFCDVQAACYEAEGKPVF